MMKKKNTDCSVARTDEKTYTTLEREGCSEFTERKSVFIGCAAPVKSAVQALDFIDRIRRKHTGASHCVFAYLLNDGDVRCSDDGEPQGTAGVPVLDVIRKSGFCDAVITVTRYFGGILLGAGGLIRAYSTAASLAVRDAGIVSYTGYTELLIQCNYPDHQKISNELEKFKVKCDHIDFGEIITLKIAVCDHMEEDFILRISEMTSGRIQALVTGKRFDK